MFCKYDSHTSVCICEFEPIDKLGMPVTTLTASLSSLLLVLCVVATLSSVSYPLLVLPLVWAILSSDDEVTVLVANAARVSEGTSVTLSRANTFDIGESSALCLLCGESVTKVEILSTVKIYSGGI